MKVLVRERLEAVGAPAWDGLVAATGLRSPFLSWTWQREWARVFAADRRLEIRCVEDGSGGLVAVLPLYEAAPGAMQILGGADVSDYRSEEHTSELQSRPHLVCRLLLEK